MKDKVFLEANQMLEDSFSLARGIYEDSFMPDHIVALWRGGTPVGMAVHEAFHFYGASVNHLAVKTASYTGIGRHGEVNAPYIQTFLDTLEPGQKVLIVDDVFDTGRTIKKMVELLKPFDVQVKVATLYWKPMKNETTLEPDYYIYITDQWIVFPHELEGLSHEEIEKKNPKLLDILGIEKQVTLPLPEKN